MLRNQRHIREGSHVVTELIKALSRVDWCYNSVAMAQSKPALKTFKYIYQSQTESETLTKLCRSLVHSPRSGKGNH